MLVLGMLLAGVVYWFEAVSVGRRVQAAVNGGPWSRLAGRRVGLLCRAVQLLCSFLGVDP
jgi:hypothetical protein